MTVEVNELWGINFEADSALNWCGVTSKPTFFFFFPFFPTFSSPSLTASVQFQWSTLDTKSCHTHKRMHTRWPRCSTFPSKWSSNQWTLRYYCRLLKKICVEWWADSFEVLYTSHFNVSRKLRRMNEMAKDFWLSLLLEHKSLIDNLTWNKVSDDCEVLKKKKKYPHYFMRFGALKSLGAADVRSAWAQTSLGDARWRSCHILSWDSSSVWRSHLGAL